MREGLQYLTSKGFMHKRLITVVDPVICQEILERRQQFYEPVNATKTDFSVIAKAWSQGGSLGGSRSGHVCRVKDLCKKKRIITCICY